LIQGKKKRYSRPSKERPGVSAFQQKKKTVHPLPVRAVMKRTRATFLQAEKKKRKTRVRSSSEEKGRANVAAKEKKKGVDQAVQSKQGTREGKRDRQRHRIEKKKTRS